MCWSFAARVGPGARGWLVFSVAEAAGFAAQEVSCALIAFLSYSVRNVDSKTVSLFADPVLSLRIIPFSVVVLERSGGASAAREVCSRRLTEVPFLNVFYFVLLSSMQAAYLLSRLSPTIS